MKKFTYTADALMHCQYDEEEYLNKMGVRGGELINMQDFKDQYGNSGTRYYFKFKSKSHYFYFLKRRIKRFFANK